MLYASFGLVPQELSPCRDPFPAIKSCMGKRIWVTNIVPFFSGCLSPFLSETSLQLRYSFSPQAAVRSAPVLFGLFCSWSVLGISCFCKDIHWCVTVTCVFQYPGKMLPLRRRMTCLRRRSFLLSSQPRSREGSSNLRQGEGPGSLRGSEYLVWQAWVETGLLQEAAGLSLVFPLGTHRDFPPGGRLPWTPLARTSMFAALFLF